MPAELLEIHRVCMVMVVIWMSPPPTSQPPHTPLTDRLRSPTTGGEMQTQQVERLDSCVNFSIALPLLSTAASFIYYFISSSTTQIEPALKEGGGRVK